MNSSIKLLALFPVLIVSVSCGGGSGSPSGGGANLYTIYESASGAQATIPGEAVQLTFGNDSYWAYSGTVYNPYGSQSSRTDTTDSSTAKYADSTMATPANWTQQLTPPMTSPYYSFCYHLTASAEYFPTVVTTAVDCQETLVYADAKTTTFNDAVTVGSASLSPHVNVCDPPSEMTASGSKFDNTYGPSVVLIQQDGAYTEMDASSQTSSSITIRRSAGFLWLVNRGLLLRDNERG